MPVFAHSCISFFLLYLDERHRVVLCKVSPESPVTQPLNSPSAPFRRLVKHEDPSEIGDDEWPEILVGAEEKEQGERDDNGRDPSENRKRLQPTLEGHTEWRKERHGIVCVFVSL